MLKNETSVDTATISDTLAPVKPVKKAAAKKAAAKKPAAKKAVAKKATKKKAVVKAPVAKKPVAKKVVVKKPKAKLAVDNTIQPKAKPTKKKAVIKSPLYLAKDTYKELIAGLMDQGLEHADAVETIKVGLREANGIPVPQALRHSMAPAEAYMTGAA